MTSGAVASPEITAAATAEERRPGIATVAAKLTAINVLGSATGFVTGPLLARALGPSGRGDLAAITVPLSLAPSLLGLGIGAYVFRTLPRGEAVGDVLGSLAVPLLLIGAIVAAAGIPIADLLAGGRPVVNTWLTVVFLSMPILLVGNMLQSSLSALQRWPRVMITTLTPFATAFIGIVCLFVAGALTVATAAAAVFTGAVLAIVPGLLLLRNDRPVFRRRQARAGISFGVKLWVGGLAQVANGRLDQLMMIGLVSPRELGLYAVAATLAGASGQAGGALSQPLMARVAAGERRLMAQAVRTLIAVTTLINLVLAALAPLILSVLFGSRFDDAIPMALILLVAQIPLTAVSTLSSALQADGAPMIPTGAEAAALIITVTGLLLLLGPLGGIGAALVSLVAYSTSFAIQVYCAHNRLGLPLSQFLVPTRADGRWAVGRVAEVAEKLRGRSK